MSEWKENSKWVVSNKGIGAATGADITAANIFKGNAYINATKELLQNVEDALDPDLPLGTAAKAVIELVYANISDIPGSDRISDIICRCAAYLEEKGDGDNPAIVRLKKANERYLSGEVRIPVLKVSDYNTIGLCGNNFDGLLREAGIRRKNGDTSGSFGYGKYAPYAKYVPVLEETAKNNGIPFRAIRIETRDQAQNAPTPITTYALFCDGDYVTNEQMNDKKFLKLVNANL